MSLDRLVGLHASVVDPAALSTFDSALGLAGSAGVRFTVTDGGSTVTVAEGPSVDSTR